MKRDFSAPILQIDGTEYSDKATLGSIACNGLLATIPGDEHMTGEQKVRNWDLAVVVRRGGVQEVSAEDIALLKERIGKGFGVAVVGRAFKLLEQDAPLASPAEHDAAADRRDMPSGAPASDIA